MQKPTSYAVQEANKLFKAPKPAESEYEIEQRRLAENHERLRAERLAREAAGAAKPR